jgi:hypothetical protein
MCVHARDGVLFVCLSLRVHSTHALSIRSGYEWRGCPQAESRRSHRTRNKNKRTNKNKESCFAENLIVLEIKTNKQAGQHAIFAIAILLVSLTQTIAPHQFTTCWDQLTRSYRTHHPHFFLKKAFIKFLCGFLSKDFHFLVIKYAEVCERRRTSLLTLVQMSRINCAHANSSCSFIAFVCARAPLFFS